MCIRDRPGAPTNVRAVAVNATAVAVQWRAPEELGTPPVHAYVLQRRAGDDPKWQVDAVLDAEELAHVSRIDEADPADGFFGDGDGSRRSVRNPDGQPARLRQYRVIAWGAHGSSGYSDPSEVVDVNAAGARRSGSGVSDASGATRRRWICLLYTSPSPRDATLSRMPSSA